MADWYVSSAAYAGYTAYQTSHVYSIGDLVVPTAPAAKGKYVFRCTTGGTSSTEPTWPVNNSSTVTSGGATFTNVTGQSTYFWTAAAGDLLTILGTNTASNRVAGGDRVFLSSDHTETQSSGNNYGSGNQSTPSFSVILFLSVSRAGSTPPVAADLTSGAAITASSGILNLFSDSPCFHFGITYTASGSNSISLTYFSAPEGTQYFRSCALVLSGASNAQIMFTTAAQGKVVLDNTPLTFSHASQKIGNANAGGIDFTWKNTASAVVGTVPNNLFLANLPINSITCRGVDLSAATNSLVFNSGSAGSKYLFDSCKIASGATRYNTTGAQNAVDEVELVNCYNGSIIVNERYQAAGTLTTETTITLSSGATDDVGTFSHKMVSNANVDKFTEPFTSFWLDVENTVTGTSKTATVEIISSGSLNNDEIALELQYDGTAGSSLASFGSSFIATPVTTPVAVTSSSATWNSSPATPVAQKLQVSFTPQHAGRVRGRVRLGKASTTVYVNPQITIT